MTPGVIYALGAGKGWRVPCVLHVLRAATGYDHVLRGAPVRAALVDGPVRGGGGGVGYVMQAVLRLEPVCEWRDAYLVACGVASGGGPGPA